MLLRGCPFFVLLLLSWEGPLLPPGHDMRLVRTLPYWGVSPFLREQPAWSVPYSLICLALGVPLLLLEHAMRWERTLPYRGVPPSSWLRQCFVGACGPCPPPLLPARSLCAPLGRGVPVLFQGPAPRGGPKVVCSGALPHAPTAQRWRSLMGWVSPSPFPPSLASHVRHGLPFGGDPCLRLSSVGFLRSKI